MTAYHVVRFKVKPGMNQKFVDTQRDRQGFPGMREGALIKTGNQTIKVSAPSRSQKNSIFLTKKS